ncbi:putative olfactory receptor 2W6 [Tachyglossus aculeatus]|uniref:putative olfactory receptor 2W6 n=1 Tax=Tachyglossus aculeatus TaxID=9261 RepID=UPI0018F4E923|nr:putative olfactory receptor 2W6 [Tachyglossus aculeatus]
MLIKLLEKPDVALEMANVTDSSLAGFILVGFSDQPRLEMVLFGVILIIYLLILNVNMTIILLSSLDPRLHTPMYFFITNLSFLDLCYITSSIPQMLYYLWGADKTISYLSCTIQLYFVLAFGGVECVLLAVMSYDRYAVFCQPLHYSVIMSPRLCGQLASLACLSGLGNSLVMSPQTLLLSRCGHRRVDHFLCEMPALISLACVDTLLIEAVAFALDILIILSQLMLILAYYIFIARPVLRIKSAVGRQKAFNTCGSHLTVVSLFYGTIIYVYLPPAYSASQDQCNFPTLFYPIITSCANPLIYSLRNKDVKGALKKVFGKEKEPGGA